jgi:hypothetical protein
MRIENMRGVSVKTVPVCPPALQFYFYFYFFRARQLMPQMHLSLRLIVQP